MNCTLQDRLVKELALREIKTIDEANKFLEEEYESSHNEKFSIEPMSSCNTLRILETGYDLPRILCTREERILSKDYLLQFHNRIYKIKEIPEILLPKGRKVEVRMQRDGKMQAFLGDIELEMKPLEEIFERSATTKSTEKLVWNSRERKPVSANHPWKKDYRSTSTASNQLGVCL